MFETLYMNKLNLYSLNSSLDTLNIIVCNEIPLISVLTKEVSKTTIYIEALDTTGYFIPYKNQKSAIKTLINKITKDYKLIILFSKPKSELIFGKANRKYKMNGKKLKDFWIQILHNKNENIYVWSNFDDNKEIPYKSMREVNFFEDDPKIKMRFPNYEKNPDFVKKYSDVNEFFRSLLCRNDFNHGAFIYSVKGEFDKKGKIIVNDENKVRDAIKSMRNQNYSSEENSKNSFKELLEQFDFVKTDFENEMFNFETEDEELIVTIKPRKL